MQRQNDVNAIMINATPLKKSALQAVMPRIQVTRTSLDLMRGLSDTVFPCRLKGYHDFEVGKLIRIVALRNESANTVILLFWMLDHTCKRKWCIKQCFG